MQQAMNTAAQSTVSALGTVLLVGVSFRSAPVPVLEKVSIDSEDNARVAQALVESEALSEAMILSTCNRMEIYTTATQFHPGLDHVIQVLAQHTGLSVSELEPHLYVRYADSAIEHMFNVASGLDSMVVGEQQIIGQLRTAYSTAADNQTVGSVLHDLTQQALKTGKRVHSETEVDAVGANMVSFAISQALAQSTAYGLPSVLTPVEKTLEGSTAIIFGAGAMATLASTYLGKHGIDFIIVANRTVDNAQELALKAQQAGVPAQGVSLEEGYSALQNVDIVITATGSTESILDAEILSSHRSSDAPLVLCDLSLPRDIDSSVETIPGVELMNIEQLSVLNESADSDAESAREIVAEECTQFMSKQRQQAVIPGIKALRQYATELLTEELSQLNGKTPDMSAKDRAEVEKTMRHLVEKLLHSPTVEVKKLATESAPLTPETALARLFALPPTLESTDISVLKGEAS